MTKCGHSTLQNLIGSHFKSCRKPIFVGKQWIFGPLFWVDILKALWFRTQFVDLLPGTELQSRDWWLGDGDVLPVLVGECGFTVCTGGKFFEMWPDVISPCFFFGYFVKLVPLFVRKVSWCQQKLNLSGCPNLGRNTHFGTQNSSQHCFGNFSTRENGYKLQKKAVPVENNLSKQAQMKLVFHSWFQCSWRWHPPPKGRIHWLLKGLIPSPPIGSGSNAAEDSFSETSILEAFATHLPRALSIVTLDSLDDCLFSDLKANRIHKTHTAF